MARPLVIMIGASKGGVGKTTVSRALADYVYQRRMPTKAFDGESPAGDLVRFVKTASVVDLSRVDAQMQVFDTVEGVTLVDLRAGALMPTLAALDEVKLLDDVRAGALGLALVHVVGPTVVSHAEIAEAAARLGRGAVHYVARNHVNETEYAGAPALDGAAVLDVPHLNALAAETVDRLGVPFDAYAGDGGQSRMLRGYVRAWLTRTWSEFDRVGVGVLLDQVA